MWLYVLSLYVKHRKSILINSVPGLARSHLNIKKKKKKKKKKLQPYNFEIIHKPGRIHSNVDALSRLQTQTPQTPDL